MFMDHRIHHSQRSAYHIKQSMSAEGNKKANCTAHEVSEDHCNV